MFMPRMRRGQLVLLALFPSVLLSSMHVARAADEGGGTVPPSEGVSAEIHVRVPPDAIVWFDGMERRGTGTLRRFVTPPLAPGYRYYYTVRVIWAENGRTNVRELHVTFRPGERVMVDFVRPGQTQSEPVLVPVNPIAP